MSRWVLKLALESYRKTVPAHDEPCDHFKKPECQAAVNVCLSGGRATKFLNSSSTEGRWLMMREGDVQDGPSGRGKRFVGIKLKVLPQYKLLIPKRNSYFNVKKVVND